MPLFGLLVRVQLCELFAELLIFELQALTFASQALDHFGSVCHLAHVLSLLPAVFGGAVAVAVTKA